MIGVATRMSNRRAMKSSMVRSRFSPDICPCAIPIRASGTIDGAMRTSARERLVRAAEAVGERDPARHQRYLREALDSIRAHSQRK